MSSTCLIHLLRVNCLYSSAFASNRDECLDRPTSPANFWDIQNKGSDATDTQVGILCGVDCKPARANLRSDGELPGTWVGITTEGDLVALTDYLEDPSYYKNRPSAPPKPSRGQLCGDFLVSMAESVSRKQQGDAEKWMRGHAQSWDTSMEGLNLLVVQNSGDQQCVGANREGSELLILHSSNGADRHSILSDRSVLARLATKCSKVIRSTLLASSRLHPTSKSPPRISQGTVTGLSNSVFSRPWRRVELGARALETALQKSIKRFGSSHCASCPQPPPMEATLPTVTSDPSNDTETIRLHDNTKELAWLVVETLMLLRTHAKPYPKFIESFEAFTSGICDRVFVPRTGMEHLSLPHVRGEYGTRSSTVVLFGRDGQVVYVEKNWYATTGERRLYEADSADGV
ncbi:hypothetical protein BGZ65_010921, partial [Modicella reniformis]